MVQKKSNTITERKVGRPTKYKPEMVDIINAYLETVGREQTKLPKRVDIARLLGVDADTLNNWENSRDKKDRLLYPKLFGALKKVDDMQKSQLMDDGLYGGKEVNASMAIFLLKANHGLKDGSGVQVNIDNRKLYVTSLPKRLNGKNNRNNLVASSKTKTSS